MGHWDSIKGNVSAFCHFVIGFDGEICCFCILMDIMNQTVN